MKKKISFIEIALTFSGAFVVFILLLIFSKFFF